MIASVAHHVVKIPVSIRFHTFVFPFSFSVARISDSDEQLWHHFDIMLVPFGGTIRVSNLSSKKGHGDSPG